MKKLICLTAILITQCVNAQPTFYAEQYNTAKTVIDEAATENGINPNLMLAIAITESGRGVGGGTNLVTPWPLAINTPSKSYYPLTYKEAHETLTKAIEEYGDSVDVGMFQVNLYYHGHNVNSPYDLLDIRTNTYVAAGILKTALKSSKTPTIAVGRYHHWADTARAQDYGTKTLKLAQVLSESNGVLASE